MGGVAVLKIVSVQQRLFHGWNSHPFHCLRIQSMWWHYLTLRGIVVLVQERFKATAGCLMVRLCRLVTIEVTIHLPLYFTDDKMELKIKPKPTACPSAAEALRCIWTRFPCNGPQCCWRLPGALREPPPSLSFHSGLSHGVTVLKGPLGSCSLRMTPLSGVLF